METWKTASQRGLVSGATASLALVYGAFGLGLAAGATLCRRD